MQEEQTYRNLNIFIQKTRILLQKEQEEEKKLFEELTQHKSYAEIQDEGAGLSNMVVIGCRDGLYDKVIISLKKSYHSQKNPVPLPDHCKLQVGDDVVVYHGDKNIAQGVIYRRTPQKIKIAINSEPEENQDFEGFKVNVVMKWNQVTYRRYHSILDILQQPRNHNQLCQLLFQATARGYKPLQPEKYSNKKMNDKQNEAISNGLIQRCHLVHGPPGTGKTTTVCELIVEAVNRGQKVLACAPSNIAVDNIVEGISQRVNCVRIGNPTRMIPEVLNKCLDFLVNSQEKNWKTEEKKLNAAQKRIKKASNKTEKKEIFGEIKELRKQMKNLQEQVITEIVEDADVICCTNAGAADRVFKRYLTKRMFDLVVIDECGQGLEVSCWIPLLKGKRAVLAGDHKQLPPTVKFQQNSLLGYTLFSRAMDELKYITSTMLEVQYRMNKTIMGWSNSMFYENKLKAHESVQNHKLRQIYDGVSESEESIMFLDTAGCQIGEQGGEMESKMNVGEADLIVFLTKKIMGYGVKPKDIAILTPYSKQVTLIKNTLNDKISSIQSSIPEVSTVDGIQGRQKQCILISLVRSNPEKQVGFLKDWRRMNVAVTRARRMLIIVGDSDTVGADKKIATLIEWVGEHGSVQSAEELRQEEQIRFGQGKISTWEAHKEENDQKQSDKKTEEKEAKTQTKKKRNKNKKEGQKKQENKEIQKKSIFIPQKHSQNQNELKREQYRKLLKGLKDKIVLEDLNSYERMIIHEVAEEMGYDHFTSEDKSRITVKVKNVEQDQQQQDQKQKQEEETKAKKKKKNKKKKQAPEKLEDLMKQSSDEGQQTKIIKINVPECLSKDEQNQQEQKTEKGNKKNKKNKKKKNTQVEPEQEEDWQKLLDQFEKDLVKKDLCFKCEKKITSVTAAQCKFCHRFFCRHDLLAEQHGCEEAARQQARKGNLDRFIEAGSRKIQEKLKQQQQQRQRKQKDDKKKK